MKDLVVKGVSPSLQEVLEQQFPTLKENCAAWLATLLGMPLKSDTEPTGISPETKLKTIDLIARITGNLAPTKNVRLNVNVKRPSVLPEGFTNGGQ